MNNVEEINTASRLNCKFANPYELNTSITCEGLDFSTDYQAVLYDLKGREVWSQEISTGSFEIGQVLTKGAYVLAISTKDGMIYQRKMIVAPN